MSEPEAVAVHFEDVDMVGEAVEECAGHDPTMTAKALLKRGFLLNDSTEMLQKKVRLPGYSGPVRCYALSSRLIEGEENG